MSHFDKLLLNNFPAESAIRRRITQEALLTQYIDAGYGRAAHTAFFKRIKSVYTRRIVSSALIPQLLGSPNVPSLLVLHLSLRDGLASLPDAYLQKFDRLFPNCLIHLLDRGECFMFRMAHKRFTAEGRVLSLGDYFSSPWLSLAQLSNFLPFSGTSMESVYCGCLSAITEGRFRRTPDASIEEDVARAHRLIKLENDIAVLQKKMANELQPRRKYQMHQSLQQLKIQLLSINN